MKFWHLDSERKYTLNIKNILKHGQNTSHVIWKQNVYFKNNSFKSFGNKLKFNGWSLFKICAYKKNLTQKMSNKVNWTHLIKPAKLVKVPDVTEQL